MKKFLYSFLGTMAGIWLSVLLGGALVFFTIIALVSSSAEGTVEVNDNSVLRITLSGELVDRQQQPSLMAVMQGDVENQISLADLVDAIHTAKTDDKIEGILIDCCGATTGLAQAEEIMTALKDFRSVGKWVWTYSDNYTQGNYFIATAADTILLNPIGMADIHGLSSKTFYFKELLDKVGVDVQVVKVGTYKSAVEPFILDDMSEANREQQLHFLGRIWDSMAQTIAQSRHTAIDSVNNWANDFLFTKDTNFYTKNGVVDKVAYRREVDDLIAKKTDTEEPNYVELADYVSANTSPFGLDEKGGDKHIAVLYAIGDITESDKDGIASDRLVPEILRIADDDNIDGLILRVNSGGGSAFASEQIWEALQQFKAKTQKPFYVSMGDMAASGGYYISCGADKIYASPLTLTGSIGIFGMIPNIDPLLRDKLGVNTVTVATNTGAYPEIFAPMSPEQRDAMQSYVDRGYELFVKRCAEGRGLTVDDIKAIAEGRVWDGLSAYENRLVDELGGLHACIADMAQALGTDYDNISIERLPKLEQQWWEPLLTMQTQLEAVAAGQPLDINSAVGLKLLRKVATAHPLQARTNFIYLN